MKKIAFHTLGCKLNFSETSDISRSFQSNGFKVVGFDEDADYYVINSCSVTRKAEKKCKSLVKQIIKRKPDAYVAVIGCFSQINPDEIAQIPGVGLVLGNAEKFNLFEYLKTGKDNTPTPEPKKPEYKDLQDFVPTYSKDGRTRSFFKIQDGCDYMCAYCTIPLARGRSRSNTIKETIKIAQKIAESDIKEMVLSGVNIGDFGKNHGQNFYGLLKELAKLQGIERVRISSIEPDLLSDEIIELVAKEKVLMPHFHIPLQSGSDEVLKDMGRRYNTALFKSRIEKIRSLVPDACIAADLIVGFPTETDDLFEDTLEFIRGCDISYVHIFTYSERDNTRAVKSQVSISKEIRNHRSRQMHALSDEKLKDFYRKNIGEKALVLWEKENVEGFMFGFTENYVKVKTAFNPNMTNEISEVSLQTISDDGVFIV